MVTANAATIAAVIRRSAGARGSNASPRLLARLLLGPAAITEIVGFSTEAFLTEVRGKPRIFLRAGLPDANAAICHELAHWAVHRFEIPVEGDEEILADDVAVALGWAPHVHNRMAVAASEAA